MPFFSRFEWFGVVEVVLSEFKITLDYISADILFYSLDMPSKGTIFFAFAVCTGRCIDDSFYNLIPQLLAWLRSFFGEAKVIILFADQCSSIWVASPL